MMRRFLAVLALVTGTLVALPAPASAAHSHTYLHFNMCGNVCTKGGTQIVTNLENSINGRSPFVVTLNEVCENQYTKLYYDLAPYFGRFDPTGPTCANGARYGNAILLRTSNYTYLGSWALPNPAGGEARRLMCLSTPLAGGPTLVACVTHISNVSGNIAAQVSAVAGVANGYDAGNAVLVGGDFNTDPGNSRMNPMYHTCYAGGAGIFHEADSANCFSRSSINRTVGSDVLNEDTHNWRKLDYIFLSGDWTGFSADATYAASGLSDHDPLWSTATLG